MSAKGKQLEAIALASQTAVSLTRVELAAKRIGRRVQAVKGPCDFFGSYRTDGRAIIFDAKETAERYRLDTHPDHLPEHQRLILLAARDAKAVAGLLVLDATGGRVFWVPAGMLQPRPASIQFTDMAYVGPITHAIDFKAVRVADDLYNLDRANRAATVAIERGAAERAAARKLGRPPAPARRVNWGPPPGPLPVARKQNWTDPADLPPPAPVELPGGVELPAVEPPAPRVPREHWWRGQDIGEEPTADNADPETVTAYRIAVESKLKKGG
jgi:hypothetical protein